MSEKSIFSVWGTRMHNFTRSVSGALLALLYGCGTICAATVSGPSGAVLVNEGKGFVPLSGPANVGPGTRVMVKPGQVATITYSDACSVKVGSGRVWEIQPGTPCPNGEHAIDLTGRMNDGMPQGHEPEEAGIAPGTALLIGGAVVGGGLIIACVVDWCKSKSSSP